MKFKKFIIPALCMAMLSAGCSGQDPVTPGNGQNGTLAKHHKRQPFLALDIAV